LIPWKNCKNQSTVSSLHKYINKNDDNNNDNDGTGASDGSTGGSAGGIGPAVLHVLLPPVMLGDAGMVANVEVLGNSGGAGKLRGAGNSR